jgi:hypothetical protein
LKVIIIFIPIAMFIMVTLIILVGFKYKFSYIPIDTNAENYLSAIYGVIITFSSFYYLTMVVCLFFTKEFEIIQAVSYGLPIVFISFLFLLPKIVPSKRHMVNIELYDFTLFPGYFVYELIEKPFKNN